MHELWSRARRTLGTAAALGVVLLACTPPPPSSGPAAPQPGEQNPVRGGTYTTSSIGDATSMQPLLTTDNASSSFQSLHYNAYLNSVNPETLALECRDGTCESSSLSPDGKRLTYKLKPNLVWSDGTPLTSADYKFTFEKMMDPKVEYRPRALTATAIEAVEAPDPLTVVFVLKDPGFCPALLFTNINPIPKHIFENLDINDNPQNLKPTVGSGPWLLKEWVKDSHAIFEANERFRFGRPNFDRYVIKIVKDQNIEYSMFKAGEIDSISLRAEQWQEAQSLPNVTTYRYYSPGSGYTYIGFNLQHPVLSDLRVRRAIAHAIDRKSIIDRIRLGFARPVNSIITPSSWAHDPTVPAVDYDPARANQLLEEAGWRRPINNPQGTRVKDGRELKLRIFYNTGNKDREQIATVAQANLKQVGIESEIIAEEFSAFLNRVNQTKDFELIILGWTQTLDPNSGRSIWTTGSGQNSIGYSNPRVDELYDQAAKVPGCKESDRQPLYAEIQRLIAADQPYVFLYEPESLLALHNRIVPNPLTKIGISYRIWEWYSRTGQ
ncbi:MAG: peptide-binding protein [Dehalococcoidia bacterium]|nr:MAG: peptide-binding protein [Dehalococcoidia bacterium]